MIKDYVAFHTLELDLGIIKILFKVDTAGHTNCQFGDRFFFNGNLRLIIVSYGLNLPFLSS